MLRTIAVALLAATMFTAPVLAQGTGGATATPPASSQPAKAGTLPGTPAPVAKTQAPTVKAVKTIKTTKKHARKHARGAKHVGVKHVKAMKHAKTTKHMRHHTRGKHPHVAVGAGAHATGKPAVRSGTN